MTEKVPNAAWETLVLFAVHFKRLNVHMNMGNVMGNVMYVYYVVTLLLHYNIINFILSKISNF